MGLDWTYQAPGRFFFGAWNFIFFPPMHGSTQRDSSVGGPSSRSRSMQAQQQPYKQILMMQEDLSGEETGYIPRR